MACNGCTEQNLIDYFASLNPANGTIPIWNNGGLTFGDPAPVYDATVYQNGLSKNLTDDVELGGVNPLLHDTYVKQSSYFMGFDGNRSFRVGLSDATALPGTNVLSDFDNSGRFVVFNAPKTDGSPKHNSVVYIQNNDPNTESWIYMFVRDITGQTTQKQYSQRTYIAAQYGYGDYIEIHPLCMSIRGNYGTSYEGRGAYANTLAQAQANSLATRYTVNHSAIINIKVYGPHVGTKWWFLPDTTPDTANTDPAYFGKFASARHQEGLLLLNDMKKDVALVKFINRATITNSTVQTAAQNAIQTANDAVYHFFSNGAGTTVDTFRVTVGAGMLSGTGLHVRSSTVLTNSVLTFMAENAYTSSESRVFVVKSNSKVIVNGLQHTNVNFDQITGNNQPWSTFHFQGSISGPANAQPSDYTVLDSDWITQMDTSTADKIVTLPDATLVNGSPWLEFYPNGDTKQVIVTAVGSGQMKARGVTNNKYVGLPGQGVGVKLIAGKWMASDILANGAVVS